jgi:hypothetical protein
VRFAPALWFQPEARRFGEAISHAVNQKKKRWDEGVSYLERETFNAFLKLPAVQRKVVREVILTFAKAYGG